MRPETEIDLMETQTIRLGWCGQLRVNPNGLEQGPFLGMGRQGGHFVCSVPAKNQRFCLRVSTQSLI